MYSDSKQWFCRQQDSIKDLSRDNKPEYFNELNPNLNKMKKVIVSMMLAGALLVGNSAFAQTQTDGNTGATQKAQKECCQNGKDGVCKGEKKDGKKGDKFGKQKGNRPVFNPFDGVQLTDDQQQRLQVLQQGLGPVQLSKEQQERIPENKNLTDEQKKQLKAERQAQKLESKKNYLNGVKEILTPDQYVIFLENVYLYSPDNQGRNMGMTQGKKFNKGDRPKGDKNGKLKKGQKPGTSSDKKK